MGLFDRLFNNDKRILDEVEKATRPVEALADNYGDLNALHPFREGNGRAQREFAKRMMAKGVYVVAFSYPVVPKGKARIRTQVCASHTKEDIDFAVKCFIEVREEMGR